MNIRVEQRRSEMEVSPFHELGDMLGWMLRSLVLLGLAAGLLYVDSSITRDENSLKFHVGKIAALGLFGLTALLVYKLWRARSNSRLIQRNVPRDAKVFFELNDEGIVYGIEDVWHKSYSWKLVKRIDCRSRSLYFEVPTGTVSVSTNSLEAEQIQETIDFFARTRFVSDRMDKWLAAAAGVERSFGPWRRPSGK